MSKELAIYSIGKKGKEDEIGESPIAWDNDIRTSVGEGNGPNVMTGYEYGARNCIVDSFLKSICFSKEK